MKAKEYEGAMGRVVINDIQVNIRHLEKRIEEMQKKGMEIIMEDPELTGKFVLLCTIVGIGVLSALYLLAELLILPPDMKAPQWVAFAGLDPREYQSGTSVKRPKRISKRGNKFLRSALYMPVMTASNKDPHIRAFYRKLVDERGKKPILAQVAVMRKLLHAIWGMFKNNEPFDGAKFHPLPVEAAA